MVPNDPFVSVPSLWIVFGPATVLSVTAGFLLARFEHRGGTSAPVEQLRGRRRDEDQTKAA